MITIKTLTSSQNLQPLDRIISNNPGLSDDDMKELVESLIHQNTKLSQKIFSVLCSQRLCRPKTLRYLIRQYKKLYPRSDDDFWKRVMSDALRSFVHSDHYLHDDMKEVMKILFQNGADPFEKNRFDRDAFQYALLSGNRSMLNMLLRWSKRNPLRRINQLITYEKAHLNRGHLISYLERTRQNFEDEGSYGRYRLRTVLGTHQPSNV